MSTIHQTGQPKYWSENVGVQLSSEEGRLNGERPQLETAFNFNCAMLRNAARDLRAAVSESHTPKIKQSAQQLERRLVHHARIMNEFRSRAIEYSNETTFEDREATLQTRNNELVNFFQLNGFGIVTESIQSLTVVRSEYNKIRDASDGLENKATLDYLVKNVAEYTQGLHNVTDTIGTRLEDLTIEAEFRPNATVAPSA